MANLYFCGPRALRRFEACDGNIEGQLTEATCDLVEGLRALDQTLRESLAS